MLTDQQVRTKINQLLDYAQKALDLDPRDRILKLNTLLDLFGQTSVKPRLRTKRRHTPTFRPR